MNPEDVEKLLHKMHGPDPADEDGYRDRPDQPVTLASRLRSHAKEILAMSASLLIVATAIVTLFSVTSVPTQDEADRLKEGWPRLVEAWKSLEAYDPSKTQIMTLVHHSPPTVILNSKRMFIGAPGALLVP